MLRPAAVLLLVFGLLAPIAAEAQQELEVAKLEFEGNREIPDDSLRKAIVNRATECRTAFLAPFCWLGLDFADDEHYFLPRELPRDAARLRIFYYQRGFREAQATAAAIPRGDDAVELVFTIAEGRPVLIDSLTVVGVEGLEDPTVVGRVPIGVGDRLSGFAVDAARDTLVRRLRNAGYAHADVFKITRIPTQQPYSARVTYEVDAGPRSRFGEIAVVGDGPGGALEEISESVIRNMLPFDEGDVFDAGEVLEAQRNLYNLEIVSTARIEEELGPERDSIVPLTVRVSESTEHRVRTGAGMSTADCLNAEARWISRNFMGGARRLQVRSRLSNVLAEQLVGTVCRDSGKDQYGELNWLVAVDFNQPWVFSARNALTASLYVERQSLPDIYVRRTVGLSVGLTHTLQPRMPLTVSYRPQRSTLEAAEVFFCTSFLVCDAADIDVLQSKNWLSGVGLSVARDRTNSVFSPSSGYSAVLDLEHADAWTGSDFRYQRVIGDVRGYYEMARQNVWALRLRAGWVGAAEFGGGRVGTLDVIHPQKRFYAGGANSVRGFPQNRLGPRVLTVPVEALVLPTGDGEQRTPAPCLPEEVVALTCQAEALEDGAFDPRPSGGNRLLEGNVEYRFPFAGQFQAALFLDAGQVWSEQQTFQLADFELSPGGGVRYFSPVGPVRIDVAYRFRGGERLNVLTSQIQPWNGDVNTHRVCQEYGKDPRNDTGCIDFMAKDELALLQAPVLFGDATNFFSRIQLHFSIGQAF